MKTFLCEYIHEEARRQLASFSEIITEWDRLPEADAIINRNLQLTEKLLQTAKNLKVIAVHGTGIDGVDLEAASRLGIDVFSVPHRNAASVAELNIALLLAAARKFSLSQRLISQNCPMGDAETQKRLQGVELSGKTVAFLGFGEIAKRTAFICKNGFSMKMSGWSRSLTEEKANEYGIRYCKTIAEAVKEADFIVLGMALTEETKGIIDASVFAAMKQGAILINTARGALVEERALLETLRSGHLAGAALDVLEQEPVTAEQELYQLPQVILTPHIGANTEDALYRVGMDCVLGIRQRMMCQNKE